MKNDLWFKKITSSSQNSQKIARNFGKQEVLIMRNRCLEDTGNKVKVGDLYGKL
jgi:hypothetical protein